MSERSAVHDVFETDTDRKPIPQHFTQRGLVSNLRAARGHAVFGNLLAAGKLHHYAGRPKSISDHRRRSGNSGVAANHGALLRGIAVQPCSGYLHSSEEQVDMSNESEQENQACACGIPSTENDMRVDHGVTAHLQSQYISTTTSWLIFLV